MWLVWTHLYFHTIRWTYRASQNLQDFCPFAETGGIDLKIAWCFMDSSRYCVKESTVVFPAKFAIKAAVDYSLKSEVCAVGWCFGALLSISSHFWYPKNGQSENFDSDKAFKFFKRATWRQQNLLFHPEEMPKVLSSLALSPTLNFKRSSCMLKHQCGA